MVGPSSRPPIQILSEELKSQACSGDEGDQGHQCSHRNSEGAFVIVIRSTSRSHGWDDGTREESLGCWHGVGECKASTDNIGIFAEVLAGWGPPTLSLS